MRVTPEENCRAFVQKFYTWYTGKPIQENGTESADEIARRQHPDYFSPELKRALAADAEAADKNPGEVVGLDGDPFLNAQDLADRYYAGLATIDDGTCKVPVFSVNHPPNQATDRQMAHQPEVIAILKQEKKHWVFQDFDYGENETLLSVLRQLADDRAVNAAEKKAAAAAKDTKDAEPATAVPKK